MTGTGGELKGPHPSTVKALTVTLYNTLSSNSITISLKFVKLTITVGAGPNGCRRTWYWVMMPFLSISGTSDQDTRTSVVEMFEADTFCGGADGPARE
jgi:hypothetical protein